MLCEPIKVKLNDCVDLTPDVVKAAEPTIEKDGKNIKVVAKQAYGVVEEQEVAVSVAATDLEPNLIPENIKKNVEAFGIIGNYEEKPIVPKLQEKTTTVNGVVLPDDGFDGLSSVRVEVPTAKPDLKSITWNDLMHEQLMLPTRNTFDPNGFPYDKPMRWGIGANDFVIPRTAHINIESTPLGLELRSGYGLSGRFAFCFEDASTNSITLRDARCFTNCFIDTTSLKNTYSIPGTYPEKVLQNCVNLSFIAGENKETPDEAVEAFDNIKFVDDIRPDWLVVDGRILGGNSLSTFQIPNKGLYIRNASLKTISGCKTFERRYENQSVVLESNEPAKLKGTIADVFGKMFYKSIKFYVPNNLLNAYKADPTWSEIADKIFSINDLQV